MNEREKNRNEKKNSNHRSVTVAGILSILFEHNVFGVRTSSEADKTEFARNQMYKCSGTIGKIKAKIYHWYEACKKCEKRKRAYLN